VQAYGASIVFDDFNVDEGHFNLAPTFSGSNRNLLASSTADRATDGPFEGAGFERLVLDPAGTPPTQERFLAGGGAIANNVAFVTTSGEDGWIGFYVRTTSPDWTVQIWLEGQENNGSIPKAVFNDGDWHLYEWNLDDEIGGVDGWGSVPTIVNGDPDFESGSYTMDSIILRNSFQSASATIDLDFVAKSASGSVAGLIPEPSSVLLAIFGLAGLVGRRRRREASD
jgi:hypothetical protein